MKNLHRKIWSSGTTRRILAGPAGVKPAWYRLM
jgi:hypothetical protein